MASFSTPPGSLSTDLRLRLKRGGLAALITIVLAPVIGGFAYGLMLVLMSAAALILGAGQNVFGISPEIAPQISFEQSVQAIIGIPFLLVFLPILSALVACVLPEVWLSTMIGAVYVGLRVGMSCRLSRIEAALVALFCSTVPIVILLAGFHFPLAFLSLPFLVLSIGDRMIVTFAVCSVVAGVAIASIIRRYVVG